MVHQFCPVGPHKLYFVKNNSIELTTMLDDLTNPAWICNHIPSKVCDDITHPFPHFNGCAALKFGMDAEFHHILYNGCNNLYVLGLKSNYVNKWVPGCYLCLSLITVSKEILIKKCRNMFHLGHNTTLIARFMGPTRGPSGADRTQVGPMLAPWTLLTGKGCKWDVDSNPTGWVILCRIKFRLFQEHFSGSQKWALLPVIGLHLVG